MITHRIKNNVGGGVLLLASALLLAGCVDDKYDLNNDIDLTMQLGTSGLQLNLGNTEPIYMNDMLEVKDDNDLQTDASGLYYLVESGATNINFNIDPVRVSVDEALLKTQIDAVSFDDVIRESGLSGVTSVPVSRSFSITASGVEADDNFKVNVDDIPADVKSIKYITPQDGRFHLVLKVNQSPNCNFELQKIENVEINFPKFVDCAAAVDGVYRPATAGLKGRVIDLGVINLSRVAFDHRDEFGLSAEDLRDGISETISMSGDFTFGAAGDFTMSSGDKATVELSITVVGAQNGKISLDTVEGVYDPVINPEVSPIEIAQNLPDFLQDEDVVVKVANPTIKFVTRMNEVPAPINFKGVLSSVVDGQTTQSVPIPSSGTAQLSASQESTIYFYQKESGPYDPEGVAEGADLYRVDNISSLIERLPDQITVDLKDRKVTMAQQLAKLRLGSRYEGHVDYDVLIPFEFEQGLRIVYNDSVDDLAKDLEDYDADSARVSATIVNTVPLKLKASLLPYDIYGNSLSDDIVVDSIEVPAGNSEGVSADISLDIRIKNKALHKLDKIIFRIQADADGSDALTSQQYILVKDMRLKLLSPIIADFNDDDD